ncbi:hypothetical protein [Nocardia sp. NBC_01327]|uniref:hypothetical protein n=1 Tax=Nocardia sp. NBC_01327 TaxID=2903593 RepID=UPI002E12420C|nr:hypothetical protein OG326_25970 [Nocardia sp. NBC_01327]
MAGTVAVFGILLATPPLITHGAALPLTAPTATMTCQESGTVSWAAPGIGNEFSTIAWNAGIDFTNCTGPAVDQGRPTPVRLTEKGTELVSCNGDVSVHTGTGEITWSDGSTGTISAGVNVQSKTAGGGHGAFPITILTGNFAGHPATDDDTVTPGQSCPGLTKATLSGTLTII